MKITTPEGSRDDNWFIELWNQGIDSHLEAFTKSEVYLQDTSHGRRKVYEFHPDEMHILIRRIEDELDTKQTWLNDIIEYQEKETI